LPSFFTEELKIEKGHELCLFFGLDQTVAVLGFCEGLIDKTEDKMTLDIDAVIEELEKVIQLLRDKRELGLSELRKAPYQGYYL